MVIGSLNILHTKIGTESNQMIIPILPPHLLPGLAPQLGTK